MTVNNLNFKEPLIEERQDRVSRDEMRTMIEENRKILEEVLKNSRKMNRFIISQQIFGFLKLLLIVVPLILGYVYLTPLLQDALVQYEELLGLTEEAKNLNQQLGNVNPEVLKKFLK